MAGDSGYVAGSIVRRRWIAMDYPPSPPRQAEGLQGVGGRGSP